MPQVATVDRLSTEVGTVRGTTSAQTKSAALRFDRAAWVRTLSTIAATGALVATVVGIVTAIGAHHHNVLSIRGAVVSLQGAGIYANESVSGAAQAIGQDVVTLMLAIPVLIAVTVLAKASPRIQVLRAGILAYLAYTYLLLAFGGAYNQLFLVYVVIYSASLFGLLLSALSTDVDVIHRALSPSFRRRAVGRLLIGFGVLLGLLWLSRVIPSLVTGAAPTGLETYSTLFVQAGDLGLIVPVAVTAGTLLLRRSRAGAMLAGVVLIKAAAFGLALLAMMVSMALASVAIAPVEVVFFGAAAFLFVAAMVHFLRSLSIPADVSEAWA
jgi:hypothetical protein